MALPQRSLSMVLILALSGTRLGYGIRSRQAHGSFRRLDHDGNFTELKPLNSTDLKFFLAKEESDPDKSVANQVMEKIMKMQIETCVHMRSLYSTKFKAYEECLDLLLKLCNPGKDMVMDGDPGETPTGQGFCNTYFGMEKIMRDEVKEHTQECVALAEKQSRDSKDGGKLKACDPFMKELCAKNADKLMDRKSKRQLTGQGYCQRYFGNKNGTARNSHCCNHHCEHECERWSTRCCTTCCKRSAVRSDGSGEETAAAGADGSGGAGGAGGSDGTDEGSEEGSGDGMRAEDKGSLEVSSAEGGKPSAGTSKIAGAAVLGVCLIGICFLGCFMFFRKPAFEEDPEEAPQN